MTINLVQRKTLFAIEKDCNIPKVIDKIAVDLIINLIGLNLQVFSLGAVFHQIDGNVVAVEGTKAGRLFEEKAVLENRYSIGNEIDDENALIWPEVVLLDLLVDQTENPAVGDDVRV